MKGETDFNYCPNQPHCYCFAHILLINRQQKYIITCLTYRLGDLGLLISIGWLISYGR